MDYEIYSEEDAAEFSIVEKETNQVIMRTKNLSVAQRVCNQLNDGCGFQGNTPNFFLNNFEKND